MTATILPFDPRPRDLIVIDAGVITKSDCPNEIGTLRFFLIHHSKAGGKAVVWEGATHDAAFDAAGEWMVDGCMLVDRTGVIDA